VALTALFRRVFGKEMSVDQYRWKLLWRAVDIENVFIVEDLDRPIFQYAGIPVRVHGANGRGVAMVSVDTMGDPEFRRRGLLTRVGAEAYARWKQQGVRYVIGVPNPNWGSRAAALGWRFLLYLRCWIRPLSAATLLARRFGVHLKPNRTPLPDHDLERITKADERFDRFWSRWNARKPRCISTVRDARWVQWRFLDAPEIQYEVYAARKGTEVSAYGVLRVDDVTRTAYVPELMMEDEASGRRLVRTIVLEARARGAEKLQVLAVEGSHRERFLWRMGFLFPRERVMVQVVPLAEARSIGLYRPLDWEVMGSDFDFQ
jgi:hypothetical protein